MNYQTFDGVTVGLTKPPTGCPPTPAFTTFAIWTARLTEAELDALRLGAMPPSIRPEALLWYQPPHPPKEGEA